MDGIDPAPDRATDTLQQKVVRVGERTAVHQKPRRLVDGHHQLVSIKDQ
jgi:hypothetical protein